MAFFDFLTGGGEKKKKPSGPHVTRQRQEGERKERMAEMETQYAEQELARSTDKVDEPTMKKKDGPTMGDIMKRASEAIARKKKLRK